MSALDEMLSKDNWLLDIDTDWESGIEEHTWNWESLDHPPLEDARKELSDMKARIAELEAKNKRLGKLYDDFDEENGHLRLEIISLKIKNKQLQLGILPKPPEEK